MKSFNIKVMPLIFTALVLSACGGGSDSSATPEPITPPPTSTTTPTTTPNVNPIVIAGADQSIDENTNIILNGSATDADGTITSYLWTQTSGTSAVLSEADKPSLSFTAPNVIESETLSFTLTATDNDGGSTSDSVLVFVARVNSPPLVSLGEDMVVDENTEITLVGVASDEDGSIFSYHLTQISGPNIITGTIETSTISFTPPIYSVSQTFVFELTVSDNDGLTASNSVSVKVNKPPTVDVGDDITVDSGAFVTLSGIANDTDGPISSYSWSQVSGSVVEIADPSALTTTFTAPTVTNNEVLVFSLMVTDGDNKSASDTVNVTVSNLLPGITGKITFDKVQFRDSGNGGVILDVANPDIYPARSIIVQLLDVDEEVVTETITNSNGVYHFPLDLTSKDSKFTVNVLAKLELDSEIDDGFNIIVTDQSTSNLLSEQTIHSAKGDVITYTSGSQTYNLHLTAGWDVNTTSFDPTKSQAQPLSILDAILNTANYLMDAGVEFEDTLPVLYINWTRAEDSSERPVGFYHKLENRIFLNGDLSKVIDNETGSQEPEKYPKIEEWNDETISHEFTHFYMAKVVGRDDSQGGAHSSWDSSTLSTAFSEGLANAISYASRDNWGIIRAPFDVVSVTYNDDLYNIALDPSNCKKEGSTWDGRILPESCYRTSVFNESTNALFILSMIDNKTATSWTSELEEFVGMRGLHQALINIGNSESALSIYSLGHELKTLFPTVAVDINDLGLKLNINLVDAWGSEQILIESELVGKDKPLPSEAYLPVHLNLVAGDNKGLCFNGGTFSTSKKRAGTFKLLKFIASQDAMVTVKIPDIIDANGNTHTYRPSATYKGEIAEDSNLFPSGNLDELEFMGRTGQSYVISVEAFIYESYLMNLDETICTSVSIAQQ